MRITVDFTQTVQPASTVTVTGMSTFNNCPQPSASCNNQGIGWAAYNNTDGNGKNNNNGNPNNPNDKTYPSFDPTIFKNGLPVYNDTIRTLGGLYYPYTGNAIQIYNSTVHFTSNYIAIDHEDHIFAQLSGTYTFTIQNADDIVLLWVGGNAYSGWTRANANLIQSYQESNYDTYSISLFAGNYYPFRIFYGNGGGALQFYASITAPDGTVVLNSNSGPSPYLVQYSCDKVVTPPFPP